MQLIFLTRLFVQGERNFTWSFTNYSCKLNSTSEEKFIKVSSANNKIISVSVIIAGCILLAIPMVTVANLIGVVLFITGIVLVFVLKSNYKCVETGEIFCKKEFYFEDKKKEKLLAAKSAGVKTVLVPEKNMRDVEDITQEITKGLEIIPVSHMDEVLGIALVKEEEKHEN